MENGAPIRMESVDHSFGQGRLRKQVLFDVGVEVREGEIVIVSGPSGSGKTTLLTLIGALRSAQSGSVRVLGDELRGASDARLVRVRRRIGYIFQSHNLLDALTASQNVQMGLLLHPHGSGREVRSRADAMLARVGLEAESQRLPGELSGGQRQRVAVARALAPKPRIILADEPTASLDRQSGREVVELIRDLAKQERTTAILVTHDSRILHVADRILHLEDGRISSFTSAVIANTRQMMQLLAHANRQGELRRRVSGMSVDDFASLLDQVTSESREFLRATDASEAEAFRSMLEEVLDAFMFKLAQILDAERASLFLVDRARRELWLSIAQAEGGRPVDLRLPFGTGIAGHVAATGEPANVPDAYADARFDPRADQQTGFRTRSILCLPLRDRSGEVFAVAQLLNPRNGGAFGPADEEHFAAFAASVGVILERWAAMQDRGAPAGE